MPYTYQNAQDDLSGIIHGKNVSKITNINAAAQRAGRGLLAKIDLDEVRVITTLNLYDQVLDTPVPADLKEKAIIDIRPQFSTSTDRPLSDNLSSRMSKDFDMRRRYGSWFTIMNNKGVKYARVKAELTPSALSMDDLTEVDFWSNAVVNAVPNGASAPFVDDIIFSQGALEFNISSGQTQGYISSSRLTSQDFTDFLNKSSAFFELYIPSAGALAAIQSIDFKWGSDLTANYYHRTITAPNFGSLQVGKNLLRFDWNGATTAGSPIITAIDSAQITVSTNGAEVDALLVSNIFFSIAVIWELEYYSKLLYSDSSGNWKSTLSDPTDVINLDEATYNLWLYEFAIACLQQIQGKNAEADLSFFRGELYGNTANDQEGLYEIYKKNNPSQREKVTSTYYNNFGFRGTDQGRFRRW